MDNLKTFPITSSIKEQERLHIWIGGLAVIILILGKSWYSQADTNALLFLLSPVTWLVHMISNQPYTFIPGQGFHFPNGNIMINGSCAGFNWLLLAFLIGVFAGLRGLQRSIHKIILLPVMLLMAYLLSLLVNSTRILFSIVILEKIAQNNTWLHLVEGTFVYLSSLILWYLVCQYFFTKFNSQL